MKKILDYNYNSDVLCIGELGDHFYVDEETDIFCECKDMDTKELVGYILMDFAKNVESGKIYGAHLQGLDIDKDIIDKVDKDDMKFALQHREEY